MRKLIVIACIAAVLVAAVVVVLPIEVSPFVPAGAAPAVRHESPRVSVQLVALSANTHLRAPPA